MGWLDDIFGFLGGVGNIFAAVYSALVWVLQLVVVVANYIWRVVVAFAGIVGDVLAQAGRFFAHLWQSFFRNIFFKVWNAIKTAQQWVETRLRPIIRWLRLARAYYDAIFRVYIKPLLDLIQHVRQVLQVLRLLHVQWAAELDAKLAQVQAEILKPFLLIRARLNQVIDLATTLAQPFGLARFVLVGLIGQRGVAAVTRLITGAHLGFWFPSFHTLAHPWEKPVTDARKLRDKSFNPGGASLIAPLVGQDTYDYTATEQPPSDSNIDALEPTFTFSVIVAEYMDAEDGFDALGDQTISLDDAVNRKVGVLFDSGRGVAKIALAGAGV